MQKWNKSAAFVVVIESILSSPVKKRNDLLTLETVRTIDKDLVLLFNDFNLKYMREMFNCVVQDLDLFLALSCIVPLTEFPE